MEPGSTQRLVKYYSTKIWARSKSLGIFGPG